MNSHQRRIQRRSGVDVPYPWCVFVGYMKPPAHPTGARWATLLKRDMVRAVLR